MSRGIVIRSAAALVAAAALVLGGAVAAEAHISVSSSSDAPGSRAILTFRVPTESDSASTVGIEIHLPADTPFQSVRVKPVAGWTAEVVETPLDEPVTDDDGNTISSAVTEIVWTATDAGLGPDEYGEFEVSVNPLPESGTVFFPIVQSYSDGTVADWVQQAEPGAAEPEHPAPSLVIDEGADAAAGHDDHASADRGAAASGDAAAAEVEAAPITSSHDGWAIGLGVAALVVALGAAGAAGVALGRTRR